MKRKTALVAGVALGLSGVALGVVLARKEGREAARRFVDQYGSDWSQKGSVAATNLANSAKQMGGQVAKIATEQYKTQSPKAKEVVNNMLAQAPQAAGALVGAFARGNQNGRHDLTEGTMTTDTDTTDID